SSQRTSWRLEVLVFGREGRRGGQRSRSAPCRRGEGLGGPGRISLASCIRRGCTRGKGSLIRSRPRHVRGGGLQRGRGGRSPWFRSLDLLRRDWTHRHGCRRDGFATLQRFLGYHRTLSPAGERGARGGNAKGSPPDPVPPAARASFSRQNRGGIPLQVLRAPRRLHFHRGFDPCLTRGGRGASLACIRCEVGAVGRRTLDELGAPAMPQRQRGQPTQEVVRIVLTHARSDVFARRVVRLRCLVGIGVRTFVGRQGAPRRLRVIDPIRIAHRVTAGMYSSSRPSSGTEAFAGELRSAGRGAAVVFRAARPFGPASGRALVVLTTSGSAGAASVGITTESGGGLGTSTASVMERGGRAPNSRSLAAGAATEPRLSMTCTARVAGSRGERAILAPTSSTTTAPAPASAKAILPSAPLRRICGSRPGPDAPVIGVSSAGTAPGAWSSETSARATVVSDSLAVGPPRALATDGRFAPWGKGHVGGSHESESSVISDALVGPAPASGGRFACGGGMRSNGSGSSRTTSPPSASAPGSVVFASPVMPGRSPIHCSPRSSNISPCSVSCLARGS